MNEYTVQIKNTEKVEVVTVRADNWPDALDSAMLQNLWAWKGEVLTVNGQPFPKRDVIYR